MLLILKFSAKISLSVDNDFFKQGNFLGISTYTCLLNLNFIKYLLKTTNFLVSKITEHNLFNFPEIDTAKTRLRNANIETNDNGQLLGKKRFYVIVSKY